MSWRSNFSFPSHRDKDENTAGDLFLYFGENFLRDLQWEQTFTTESLNIFMAYCITETGCVHVFLAQCVSFLHTKQ